MNHGIKIIKPGRSLDSENPNDYVFWSKNPTLQLMETKIVEITVGSGGCSGTEIVDFDYDFVPLVIGRVKQTSAVERGPYIMPTGGFFGIDCDGFDIPNTGFGYKVKSSTVEVNYVAECIEPQVGSTCPLSGATFVIELEFYMWRLGSVFPFV